MTKRREFEALLDVVLAGVREGLLTKNAAYGDSALNPIRIFSRLAADEGLRVRIDDKLSRLARGDVTAFGEHPERDLLGYLILLEMQALAETEARRTIDEI